MTYRVLFSKEALAYLDFWQKSGQKKILAEIASLVDELKVHPTTGTGKVEQLKGDMAGLWSRRIDKSSRMLYSIEEDRVIVNVISLRGHYGDK